MSKNKFVPQNFNLHNDMIILYKNHDNVLIFFPNLWIDHFDYLNLFILKLSSDYLAIFLI